MDLRAVAAAWRRALDSDDRALAAIAGLWGALRIETAERRHALALERRDVESLLR